MQKYSLFKPSYKKAGVCGTSNTHHIRFNDHRGRRQTLAGFTDANKTHQFAGKLMRLVECRQSDSTPSPELAKWLDTQPDKIRRRFEAMDLISAESTQEDRPLLIHLDGDGTTVGYVQAMRARGATDGYITTTINRLKAVLAGCGFIHFAQLAGAGASTTVEVWLGDRREKKLINGSTFNKTVADLKRFCRWLHKEGRARTIAMTNLQRVGNADADAIQRRSLSADEARCLVDAAAASPRTLEGVTGEERAHLWRFLFTTGIRPGQLRELKVSDFDLESNPPTVKAAARFVKRRKVHVQELQAGIAADLRRRFAKKLPTAAAFRMPCKHRLADVFKADLKAARDAWLNEVANNPKELEQRQRNDFLCVVNHAGETAVAYSLRHGFGSFLAKSGAPESVIAKAMHHASRTTTTRYIHADRTEVGHAISKLPEMNFQAATGTDGPTNTDQNPMRLCTACADSKDSAGFGGNGVKNRGSNETLKIAGKLDNSTAISESVMHLGVAESADATDLKSVG
jgi:integrase